MEFYCDELDDAHQTEMEAKALEEERQRTTLDAMYGFKRGDNLCTMKYRNVGRWGENKKKLLELNERARKGFGEHVIVDYELWGDAVFYRTKTPDELFRILRIPICATDEKMMNIKIQPRSVTITSEILSKQTCQRIDQNRELCCLELVNVKTIEGYFWPRCWTLVLRNCDLRIMENIRMNLNNLEIEDCYVSEGDPVEIKLRDINYLRLYRLQEDKVKLLKFSGEKVLNRLDTYYVPRELVKQISNAVPDIKSSWTVWEPNK